VKKLVVFLLAAVLLVACASVAVDVRYNFDKNADFSSFKTYKWVPMKDAPKIDDFRDKQIKDAVDSELAKRGLTKTDADSADLYLGYRLELVQRHNLPPTKRTGDMVRVGPGAVGTVVWAA